MANARWAIAVLLMVVIAVVGAEAATDCETALKDLSGCFSFLTNPSSTPDEKLCCQPLKTVLATPASFQCLCAQATSSSNSALLKNALNLPKACNLEISVSEANCTTSTTPSGTPSTANVTTPAGSSGFLSSLPNTPFVMALAFLCAATSFIL